MNPLASKLFESATFTKAGKSADVGGHCVEVARAHGLFGVRDSRDPEGAILVFTPDEWDAFIGGVREGEFG